MWRRRWLHRTNAFKMSSFIFSRTSIASHGSICLRARRLIVRECAEVIDHVPTIRGWKPEPIARHGRFSEGDLPPQQPIRLLLHLSSWKSRRTHSQLCRVRAVPVTGRSVTSHATRAVGLSTLGDRQGCCWHRIRREDTRPRRMPCLWCGATTGYYRCARWEYRAANAAGDRYPATDCTRTTSNHSMRTVFGGVHAHDSANVTPLLPCCAIRR